MVLPSTLVLLSPDLHVLRPEPGSLSEKVSHLESMLRKLQDDLQKVMGWAGVGGELQGCLGKGVGCSDNCLSLRPRRKPIGQPWRRRCEIYGTTTGGCRLNQRVQPPACFWPPSSWAHPPLTWPELSGPASAWLWTCSGPSGHLGHTGPQALLRNSPCAEAHPSTAPTPQPIIWW